jgi:hypothetical protein
VSADAAKRESVRHALGRLVSALSSGDTDFREQLVTDKQGRRVAIPALPKDSLHDMCRLAFRSGGQATLVVPTDEGSERVSLLLVNVSLNRLKVSASAGECDLPVGLETTVADLLKFLRPGSSVTISLGDSALLAEETAERQVSDAEAAGLVTA